MPFPLLDPSPPPPLGTYMTSRPHTSEDTSVFQLPGAFCYRLNMTESSSNKLLNGDACQRSSKDKKSGKNGFVKNHCLFQQPQKYRRPREKVRPSHPLLDNKPLTREEQGVFILILSIEIDAFTSLPA